MRYFILLALALLLTGCPAVEKYKAEQEAAVAQQMEQQARMVEAQTQAQMMDTLAQASKPNYWPIIATVGIFALVLLLVIRWHMITVSHVAAGQPVQELRMLPGDVPFARMRLEAWRQGYQLEAIGDAYYLVDSQGNRQKIRALIEQGDI